MGACPAPDRRRRPDSRSRGAVAVTEQRERELKLSIRAADLSRLGRMPALRHFRPGRAVTRRLRSIYYDTPRLDLWQQGVFLRVRQVGQRRLQTIKSDARKGGGFVDAREWERELRSDAPDLSWLPDGRIAQVFAPDDVRHGLAPAFETEVRRTVRELRTPTGAIIELAIDAGEIRAGGGTAEVCEAELELKAGEPAALFEVAEALSQELPLRLSLATKAERGFALLTHAGPSAQRARVPALAPTMSAEQGFAAIVENCLEHALANEAVLLAGTDIEGVHQMRVALRRLRSAITAFRAQVDGAATRAVEQELRWIAGVLGPARNADVFEAGVLPPVGAAIGEDARFAWFAGEARELRQRHGRAAIEAVGSARYSQGMLRLGAWLAGRQWRDGATHKQLAALERPVPLLAAALLRVRFKKVRKLGNRLAALDEAALHQLRIRVKRLRYCAEFFRALFPDGAPKAFAEDAAALQDSLGYLNDKAAARSLVAELRPRAAAQGREADLAWAAGAIAGWHAHEAQRCLRQTRKQWRRLKRRGAFWQ
ncbi:MAG: CHAD domain-containing protein [Alphaproteobacteria bacterium]|nr:CHAD domain-containing protein [Alphaproteobacteria bacterium]